MTIRHRYPDLLRHAERYGGDGIIELVAPADRPRFQLELDAVEAKRAAKGRFTKPRRRPRRTPGETRELVAALRSEGLVAGAIADRLGISDAYVRKLLAKVRDSQNVPR